MENLFILIPNLSQFQSWLVCCRKVKADQLLRLD